MTFALCVINNYHYNPYVRLYALHGRSDPTRCQRGQGRSVPRDRRSWESWVRGV